MSPPQQNGHQSLTRRSGRQTPCHPNALNKNTVSEHAADVYIAPFPKVRSLKHTHLVSLRISELLTSRWKTKRQPMEKIRRLMPLSPYYQSSWGENKAGYLWEQHTKMKTPLWVVHQTTLQSDQTVTCSQAPRWSLLTLQMDGNPNVLNFFNCLVSCCFNSQKGKKRSRWIRKCWSLFSLVRGAPSHPVLFSWCCQVPGSIRGLAEGRTEGSGWVSPEPTGQWEAIGR